MDRFRNAVSVSVVLALSLALSACGGDAKTEGSDEGSAPTRLRIVNTGQYDPTALGPDAGVYLGTFKDGGLDVEALYGQDVVEALASGDVQLGITSPNRIVAAVERGLEAKIIGTTVTSWVQYIIVGKKSGVTSLEDFKGGRIGISRFGSAGHYSALKLAESLGWDEGDYELVPLSDLDGLSAALESDTIDAFMWSAEASFGLEAEGSGVIVGNAADVIDATPLNVLVATDQIIADDPGLVASFCDAFYEAQSEFAEDPKVAAEAFESWGADPAIAQKVIESSMQYVATSSALPEEAFANIADATNATIEGAKVTADDVKGMYTDCSTLG